MIEIEVGVEVLAVEVLAEVDFLVEVLVLEAFVEVVDLAPRRLTTLDSSVESMKYQSTTDDLPMADQTLLLTLRFFAVLAPPENHPTTVAVSVSPSLPTMTIF